MKKGLWLLFVLVLTVSVVAACGSKDVYTVATDNNYVPFEYLDVETGEIIGFDIDLIQAIADEAGFEIKIEAMEFDGVLSGIRTGRVDMGIAGMTITEERSQTIDFSSPYYDAGLILAVRSTETEIQSEADLAGKRVGTRSSTTSEDYLRENHPTVEVVGFPGIVEAYLDLELGRLDAVLYDVPNVMYYIQTEGKGTLKTAGDLLTGEQYGIGFPKGSELVDDVNKALQTLIDNGTYDDIYEKWFGSRPYGN